MSESRSDPDERPPVAVLAHLSGRFRGRIHRLDAPRLRIGTAPDVEIRFSEDDLTPGLSDIPESGPYAVLEHVGERYVLRAAASADVWVNGRRVDECALDTGDVLEIGEGGPVLRFRLYPPGSPGYKSVADVFADCAECVRHGRGTVDRAGLLLARPPVELLTRTAPWVRGVTLLVLVALLAAVAALWTRAERLEHRLRTEFEDVRGLADALARGDARVLPADEVDGLRRTASANVARIEALERRRGARGRVIAAAARSVAFVQGAWGFEHPDGRPLRFVGLLPDGQPIPGPGGPAVTLEGDGPPVEILYTGTGFVVDTDGLMLTNRHVAEPWQFEESAAAMVEQGLRPVIRRLVGYLPGLPDPFDLRLVRSSDVLDVSLLRCDLPDADIRPLALADRPAAAGDDVVVLGYPTGITALVARADPAVLEELAAGTPPDFWQAARLLAQAGMIAPLATAGVVGQVTPTAVVYDAETTHGGSGGPVLDLDGRVLAVNAAMLAEFGGSNLGVPAVAALDLLRAEPAEGAAP